jgi:hypothetical protein
MSRFIPFVVAALALASVSVVLVTAPRAAAEGQTPNPSASASVVHVDTIAPPRRIVINRRFRPWSRPTPSQVREIIRAEARRWRISESALARRVGCESRFRWWAGNGAFQGVLQFSWGTFHRGLRTMRDRRVTLRRERVRRVHTARVEHFSDGRTATTRGRAYNQHVIYVLKGRLPRRPAVSHAWAQIRIGSQAIRGISAVHNSEWSCSA